MTLNSIDISLYTGEVSQAQANQLVTAGLQHLVIGYDTSQLSDDQRDVFCQAGVVAFDVYRYVYFNQPIQPQIDNVLEAISKIPNGDMMPGFLWLDVEQDIGLSTVTIQQAVIDAVTAARKGIIPVGIYTGKWFWDKYLSGWTWPADNGVFLWNAFWDGTMDVDSAVLFGGWTPQLMIGKQYAGNLPSIIPAVDGDVFRDRNAAPPIPGPVTPPGPDYGPQIKTLTDDVTQLTTDLAHVKEQMVAINKATE